MAIAERRLRCMWYFGVIHSVRHILGILPVTLFSSRPLPWDEKKDLGSSASQAPTKWDSSAQNPSSARNGSEKDDHRRRSASNLMFVQAAGTSFPLLCMKVYITVDEI